MVFYRSARGALTRQCSDVFCTVSDLNRKTLDILYKITLRSTIDYGLNIFYSNLKQCTQEFGQLERESLNPYNLD